MAISELNVGNKLQPTRQVWSHENNIAHGSKRRSENSAHPADNFSSIEKQNNVDMYKSAGVNFKGGFFNAEKLATSKFIQKFAVLAYEKASIFESAFAVGITCFLRPATNLVMPGAEKRDKQYASAQSIASGLTGLAVPMLLQNPITNAGENLFRKVQLSKLEHLKNWKGYEKLQDKPFKEAILELDDIVVKNETKAEDIIEIKKEEIKALQKGNKKAIDQKAIDKITGEIKDISDKAEATLHDIFNIPSQMVKNKEVDPRSYKIDNSIKDMAKIVKNPNQKHFSEEILKKPFAEVIRMAKLDDKLEYLKAPKAYETLKYLTMSYGPKLLITPILALVTIKGITPVMKLLFPKEPKKQVPAVEIKPRVPDHFKNETVFKSFVTKEAK